MIQTPASTSSERTIPTKKYLIIILVPYFYIASTITITSSTIVVSIKYDL